MLDKALALARVGFFVFPTTRTSDGRKIPAVKGGAGHLDATTDEAIIRGWWEGQYRKADVGVWAGASNIVVLDIDVKDGIDGFDSLGFLDPPETVYYQTPGGGYHYIYEAPEGVPLRGDAPYRGMVNVDRRAGSSWVIWYGEAPTSRVELTPAPEWLCDPAIVKSRDYYKGDLEQWFQGLVPGRPSAAVRKTMASIDPDMSHDEMVKAQHHAIRLGAEGHPGVEELLGALEEAFLNRDPSGHVTPQKDWESKFAEALSTGIEQFGGGIALLNNLPEFRLGALPPNAHHNLFTGVEGSKADWTRALNELLKGGWDNDHVLSAMWNAPKLRPLSMDWGIEFVHKRIVQARAKLEAPEDAPTPTPLKDEAPGEEAAPKISLLTDEQRRWAKLQYTFVDYYTATGRLTGFVNKEMYEPAAWTVASLACGYKAFISASDTDILPLNLWFVSLAYSGTGKTRAAKFEETVIKALFDQDNLERQIDLSGNTSPQDLHIALIERNRQPTIMFEDEAAGFFRRMNSEKWMESMQQDMSKFYDGGVPTINKVSQAHLKGKSATTSFNLHFYSTPQNFYEQVVAEHFQSGYLARANWILGKEAEHKEDSVRHRESRTRGVNQVGLSPAMADLAGVFWELRGALPNSLPVWTTKAALDRMDEMGNTLMNGVQGHSKFDVLEPALRRMAWETVRKVSAILALTNGFIETRVSHVETALLFVEKWVENLYRVAELVDRSVFFKKSMEIVDYIASRRESSATQAQVYKQFAPGVQRDPRELQARIDLMVNSGYLVAEVHHTAGVIYRVNR